MTTTPLPLSALVEQVREDVEFYADRSSYEDEAIGGEPPTSLNDPGSPPEGYELPAVYRDQGGRARSALTALAALEERVAIADKHKGFAAEQTREVERMDALNARLERELSALRAEVERLREGALTEEDIKACARRFAVDGMAAEAALTLAVERLRSQVEGLREVEEENRRRASEKAELLRPGDPAGEGDGEMRLVIVESPYAGATPEAIAGNVAYARAALADCLRRGEAPFASHLLYTQPGVLRDEVPAERRLGIAAGFAWGNRAKAAVFYLDLGWSSGMRGAVEHWRDCGVPIEERYLGRAKEAQGG